MSQGSLCGTVRDEASGQGVPEAGVFLFLQDGSYSGLLGVTDETGYFCIHDIPAGTYDLQIRVDNYQIGYRADLVIPDTVSNVEIIAIRPPYELMAPWPNPSDTRVFFRLRIDGDQPAQLKVFDLRGRLVKGWSADSALGELTFDWDFRDSKGRDIPVGLYLLRMEAGDWSDVRTFVRLR